MCVCMCLCVHTHACMCESVQVWVRACLPALLSNFIMSGIDSACVYLRFRTHSSSMAALL